MNRQNLLLLSTALLFGLLACGDEELPAPALGLGWKFDYKNYYLPDSEADLRSCNNKPAVGVPRVAYDAIATVTYLVEDPEGQVPPVSQTLGCDESFNVADVDVRNIPFQTYRILIEAKSADGTVLYRYENNAYELEEKTNEVFTLQAATGELRFTPSLPDGLGINCPTDVNGDATLESLSYDFSLTTPDEERNQLVAVGSISPVCEVTLGGALTLEIFIRNIPIDTQVERDGDYITDSYTGELSLDNASEPIYCKTLIQPIQPGLKSIGDQAMGSCP